MTVTGERGTHAWDVAAGTLLVKEAGGFVNRSIPIRTRSNRDRSCREPQLFDEFSAVIRQRDWTPA